jgi:hypothetical protein
MHTFPDTSGIAEVAEPQPGQARTNAGTCRFVPNRMQPLAKGVFASACDIFLENAFSGFHRYIVT